MLFLSPLLAMPAQHGGCVYPNAVLNALHAAGTPIDYAWLAWPLRARRAVMRDPLQAGYVRRGYVPGTCRVGAWRFRTPREWCSRSPAPPAKDGSAETLPGPPEQTFFRKIVRRLKPRTVLVDFTTTLPVLDSLTADDRANIRVAVLTHNLIHRRTELYRERGVPLDFRALTRDEEAALLRRADVIVAIQEREAEEFRAMAPDREVVVVPMPVEPCLQMPAGGAGYRCLFVGGYSGHNLDGLRWFLSEVWPAVLKVQPEAELDVVGTVGKAVPADAPQVHAHGPQSELSDAYARAAVCVVPLRFGTGLKIKLIEAMAHGRAAVTTSAGAEGFPELEAGEVAAVADDAQSMAKAITDLLHDETARELQVARQNAWLRTRCAASRAILPLLEFESGRASVPAVPSLA